MHYASYYEYYKFEPVAFQMNKCDVEQAVSSCRRLFVFCSSSSRLLVVAASSSARLLLVFFSSSSSRLLLLVFFVVFSRLLVVVSSSSSLLGVLLVGLCSRLCVRECVFLFVAKLLLCNYRLCINYNNRQCTT